MKPAAKPIVEQSFDIDDILQGRMIQPHPQPSKFSNALPTRNKVASPRRDSLSDWLSDEISTTGKGSAHKVTTTTTSKQNPLAKPVLDLHPDDFFSGASNNNRETSATKGLFSTTKSTAKQYYLGSSRYKPGK